MYFCGSKVEHKEQSSDKQLKHMFDFLYIKKRFIIFNTIIAIIHILAYKYLHLIKFHMNFYIWINQQQLKSKCAINPYIFIMKIIIIL